MEKALSYSLTLLVMAASTASAEVPVLPGSAKLSLKAKLGQELFFDTNLSEPAGQSCSTCHDPARAFTDPDNGVPTSQGALVTLQGNRNTPTAMYSAYAPEFHLNDEDGLYYGGQFLDGRAATLEDQAKGPFLNPLEMANPDIASVIAKVRNASYASMFEEVFGSGALDDDIKAYQHMAQAIASFERSPVLNRFSSKYDFYLAGKARLSAKEARGLKVFDDEDKGNCAACHPSKPSADGTPPLFTDHSYDNIGVPKNPDSPFYSLPSDLNPNGVNFVDKGLANTVHLAEERGKIKVPTLRNVALTAPYMHNGYFKTLEGVVLFYNNRDIRRECKTKLNDTEALKRKCWPAPEIKRNENFDELGELNLSARERSDLVAFLKTLSDGYRSYSPWPYKKP